MDVSRVDVSKMDVVTESSNEPMDGRDGRSHCRGYGFGEAEPFLDRQRLAGDDQNAGHMASQTRE